MWCFLALVTWQATTGAADAVAQRRGRTRLGPARPEAGFRLTGDLTGGGPGVGAQVKLPLARALDIMPSTDWVFSGTRKGWQFNLDGAIRIGRLQAAYIGGGVGIANNVSKPNLFVGLAPGRRIAGREAHAYFEARWTLTDPSRFMMVMGMNFRVGN